MVRRARGTLGKHPWHYHLFAQMRTKLLRAIRLCHFAREGFGCAIDHSGVDAP